MKTAPQLVLDDHCPPLAPQLADVLAEMRAEAKILERHGRGAQAATARDFAKRVEAAVRPRFTFLSETNAAIFTGLKPRAVRRRFAELQDRGLAYLRGGVHFYCEATLQRNSNVANARSAGRAAARERAA